MTTVGTIASNAVLVYKSEISNRPGSGAAGKSNHSHDAPSGPAGERGDRDQHFAGGVSAVDRDHII
jgi:hypothetical protein